MRLNHRCVVVVLSGFLLTCAHDRGSKSEGARHVNESYGGGDVPMSAIERDDGELVSGSVPAAEEAAGDYRDPTVVTDDSTAVPEDIKDLAKAYPRSAPAAPPPRLGPPPAPARAAPAAASAKPRGRYISGRATPHGEDEELPEVLRSRDKVGGKRSAESDEGVSEAPRAPALKAGRHDDNKEYNRFLAFLAENHRHAVYATDVSERLLVRALDGGGHSLPNCPVLFKSTTGQVLAKATTYADGSTQFFPAAMSGPDEHDYVVEVRYGNVTRKGQLARKGVRSTDIRFFDVTRKVPARVPVDVAIVLDTTGSMQGQIDRLKQTLKAIHYQLTSLSTHPDIRFGMVAYRDKGDDYVTQVTQFTSNIESYQTMLRQLVADGGGDQPEDLQTALNVAMHQLKWRPEALRIGFIITDAPPHTDYGQDYNYLEAMNESLARGIKWVTVGAGGLNVHGEVIYRPIAQYTMGEYVFVTERGGDDSEGGVGEASHHVGANYRTENLDQAIVRIVRRELSYLTDSPKDFDTTIVATGDKSATREQVYAPAVAEALRQLADYSALKLGGRTLVAVAPVTTAEKQHRPLAEYLTDQLTLAASRNEFFKVVERDLKAVTQEMKLQLSNLFDESKTVPIGKMLGAEMLIVSKLVVKNGEAELFAKLVRVATGEVLSVANVRVTGGAGLGS
jgi:Mg-chelatase subunit ChlD